MFYWLIDNKEWIFSGVGIAVLVAITSHIRQLLRSRRFQKKLERSTTSNEVDEENRTSISKGKETSGGIIGNNKIAGDGIGGDKVERNKIQAESVTINERGYSFVEAESINMQPLEKNPEHTANSLGKYVVLLVAFILISACIGYIQGNRLQNTDEYLKSTMANYLAIEQDSEGYFLTYQCSGLPVHYRLDQNTIEDYSFTKPQTGEHILESIDNLFDNDVLTAALVGSTSGLAANKILGYPQTRTNSRNSRAAIVSFVGLISGYSLGYYVANSFRPKCDSENIIKLVRDSTVWDDLTDSVWKAQLAIANNMQQKIIQCSSSNKNIESATTIIQSTNEQIEEIIRRLSKSGYDHISADFEGLDIVNNRLQQYILNPSFECPSS